MSRQEMIVKIMETKDMCDVGTWMMEAIPETINKCMVEVFDDIDNLSDEDSEEFFKALWTALFIANACE